MELIVAMADALRRASAGRISSRSLLWLCSAGLSGSLHRVPDHSAHVVADMMTSVGF